MTGERTDSEPVVTTAPDLAWAYRRFRTGLFNYFRRCGVPRPGAEDLTQGVFLVLLEGPDRYASRLGGLRPFLFGIARNLRRNWERRGFQRDEPLEVLGTEPAQNHADPALGDVRRAVAGLPGGQREALILREFHGFRYDEIAAIQEVPVGTVRSRIARAREVLRHRLRPHAGPTGEDHDVS